MTAPESTPDASTERAKAIAPRMALVSTDDLMAVRDQVSLLLEGYHALIAPQKWTNASREGATAIGNLQVFACRKVTQIDIKLLMDGLRQQWHQDELANIESAAAIGEACDKPADSSAACDKQRAAVGASRLGPDDTELWAEHYQGLEDDKRRAATPAAIQRGDGQTGISVLHQLSAAFSKRGYSPARAAAKIPEELNGIRCILLEIGQMLTTPPTDEPCAKLSDGASGGEEGV